MFLLCQNDAYLQEATCELVSCDELPNGRFAVTLVDSVLYPEGGGQPHDLGTIEGQRVSDVQKAENGGVVCTIKEPLASGQVHVVVDWKRRYDHMQQHTAQHLLTALANEKLNAPTVGFHLGIHYSAIELDVPEFDEEAQQKLLLWANETIRENRAIQTHHRTPEEYEQMGDKIRSRRLPAGHSGNLRLVEIKDLDLNTCGGTHLRSTGELQMITIVGLERIRQRVRLLFLAGHRVQTAFRAQHKRERAFTQLLHVQPKEHIVALEKQKETLKSERNKMAILQQELIQLLGQSLAAQEGTLRSMHRTGADLKMLGEIAKVCRNAAPDSLVVLTSSEEERGEGIFLVSGEPEAAKQAGSVVSEILKGRGGGRPGIFQGKVTRIERRMEVIQKLRSHL